MINNESSFVEITGCYGVTRAQVFMLIQQKFTPKHVLKCPCGRLRKEATPENGHLIIEANVEVMIWCTGITNNL